MTVFSQYPANNLAPECHSEHAFRGISNPLANPVYTGNPHGAEYAHHQMRLLCRISREATEGPIDAPKAFMAIKETISAVCEERIGQQFLKHNVILMDDMIFHIRKAVAHLPMNADLKNEFGVKDRQSLEDILLGMEYYVTGEMDPRDMMAEIDMLARY